jgi:hypothetical protein
MQGLDLAERLYRHAVETGKLAPIPGIPTSGPLLFQQAVEPAAADQPRVPSRWEVPAQAGRGPAEARPAAPAVGAQRAPATQQRRGSYGGTAAAAVLSPDGYGGKPSAAGRGAAAAVPRPHARPVATEPAYAAGYAVAGPQTGAAAIAATFAAAAGGAHLGYGGRPAAAPALPSAAAYSRGYAGAPPSMPQQQPQQHRRDAAEAAGAPALNYAATAGHAARAGPSSQPQQPGGAKSDVEVIELLDDDDLPPLAQRLAAAVDRAAAPSHYGSAPAREHEAGSGRVNGDQDDTNLALMVEMGFSDKKARKVSRPWHRLDTFLPISSWACADILVGNASPAGFRATSTFINGFTVSTHVFLLL